MSVEDLARTPTSARQVCIATTGNCQSTFLASVLTSIPGAHVEYFGKQTRFHPFEGRTAAANPPETLLETLARWKAEGNRVILCEQTWPIVDPTPDEALAGCVDQVVRFPNIEAYCLWPDRKYRPDQLERISLARTRRLDIANIKAAESKADIAFSDLFDGPFQAMVPFDSERHPTAPIFAMMHARIFASRAFAELKFDRDDLVARIAASRGLNTAFNHPISLDVARAHGLGWAETAIYTRWIEALEMNAARNQDALKAIEDVLNMEASDPFFARMIKPFALTRYSTLLWSAGRRDEAMAARARAIEIDPYNVTWRVTSAKFFMTFNQPEKAIALVEESRAFIPSAARLEEIAGDAHMTLGKLEEGRAYYLKALAATPNHITSIRRLLLIETERVSASADQVIELLNSTKYIRGKLRQERLAFVELAKSIERFKQDLLVDPTPASTILPMAAE